MTMRKALAILIVLVILCTSGVIAAHAVVNTQRDQVVISENVIYGDKLAADGLNIVRKATWDERLHWKTDYNISAENKYRTDFRFTQEREYERSIHYTQSGVSLGLSVGSGMGSSHEITREDITRLCSGYEDICLDVMETAPAGEEYTAQVRIADYLDIYPIQVYVGMSELFYLAEMDSGRSYLNNLDTDSYTELNNAIRDYFSFPVHDGDLLEVRVYKNEAGMVTELSVGTWEYTTEFRTLSAVTPNGAYFAFDCGEDIDFSNSKDGCGIYCLPSGASLVYEGVTYPTVDIDGLDMVYPLDESTIVENMFYDEERDVITLVTVENDKFMFTVIDANTMETLQRIEIDEREEDGGVWQVSIEEDFFVIYLSGKRLAVLEIHENDEYTLEFVADFMSDSQNELFWYNSNSAKAYDGERLAISWSREIEDSPYSDCGFYIAVYDKTGLLYYGEYLSGLMTGRNGSDYNYYCQPVSNGIALEWK